MKSIQYDNPNDIDYLSTLKIKAYSGNLSPQIYANGKNQLPIQITVQAVNKDGKVLNFSNDTWLSILSLCFSENGEKLTKKGSSGWCYTDVINDYSEEILSTENFQIEPLSVQIKKHLIFYKESENINIIMYVYSYDANKIKRISVNLDTNNGKHFTTADNPVGAEKMSVAIKTLRPIYYDTKNIDFNYTDFSRGEAKWSKDKHVYLTTRQRNYSLTTVYNNRFIKNHSFSNFSETENNKQLGSGWFYFDFHRYLYVGYCWQPDVISPHTVTIYDKKDDTFDQSINIDRKNGVCLTIMRYLANNTVQYISDVFNPGMNDYYYSTSLIIYDQYGNKGEFYIKNSDYDELYLEVK